MLCTQTTREWQLFENAEITLDYYLAPEIIERILAGKILEEDAQTIKNYIADYLEKYPGSQVILGCTEFSLLHEKYPLHVSVLDGLSILAEELTC